MKGTVLLLCIAIVFALSSSCIKNCPEGVADPNCICTMQYDPVCGCDGKTYGNPCMASCSGISEYRKGKCR